MIVGASATPTGYQQGVLTAIGSYNGDRFAVRSRDRHYCDAVQPLFGTAVYLQRSSQPGREDFYTVKSSRVCPPELDEIADIAGFARAYIEIHGVLDLRQRWHSRRKKDYRITIPRLRIFGQPDVLDLIAAALPAGAKKLQHLVNSIPGGYTGETWYYTFQSPAEVAAIIDWLDGEPRNEAVWARYKDLLG